MSSMFFQSHALCSEWCPTDLDQSFTVLQSAQRQPASPGTLPPTASTVIAVHDNQNCSVLYCVLKLYTVISTLRWAVLTVLWIGLCVTGFISLCLDSFVFMFVFFVCLSCHTAYVLYYCNMVVSWRCGRVSDLRSRGRGFESRLGTRRKNLGQVSHTYVPLSPSSISWYWPKGGDARRLGR